MIRVIGNNKPGSQDRHTKIVRKSIFAFPYQIDYTLIKEGNLRVGLLKNSVSCCWWRRHTLPSTTHKEIRRE